MPLTGRVSSRDMAQAAMHPEELDVLMRSNAPAAIKLLEAIKNDQNTMNLTTLISKASPDSIKCFILNDPTFLLTLIQKNPAKAETFFKTLEPRDLIEFFNAIREKEASPFLLSVLMAVYVDKKTLSEDNKKLIENIIPNFSQADKDHIKNIIPKLIDLLDRIDPTVYPGLLEDDMADEKTLTFLKVVSELPEALRPPAHLMDAVNRHTRTLERKRIDNMVEDPTNLLRGTKAVWSVDWFKDKMNEQDKRNVINKIINDPALIRWFLDCMLKKKHPELQPDIRDSFSKCAQKVAHSILDAFTPDDFKRFIETAQGNKIDFIHAFCICDDITIQTRMSDLLNGIPLKEEGKLDDPGLIIIKDMKHFAKDFNKFISDHGKTDKQGLLNSILTHLSPQQIYDFMFTNDFFKNFLYKEIMDFSENKESRNKLIDGNIYDWMEIFVMAYRQLGGNESKNGKNIFSTVEGFFHYIRYEIQGYTFLPSVLMWKLADKEEKNVPENLKITTKFLKLTLGSISIDGSTHQYYWKVAALCFRENTNYLISLAKKDAFVALRYITLMKNDQLWPDVDNHRTMITLAYEMLSNYNEKDSAMMKLLTSYLDCANLFDTEYWVHEFSDIHDNPKSAARLLINHPYYPKLILSLLNKLPIPIFINILQIKDDKGLSAIEKLVSAAFNKDENAVLLLKKVLNYKTNIHEEQLVINQLVQTLSSCQAFKQWYLIRPFEIFDLFQASNDYAIPPGLFLMLAETSFYQEYEQLPNEVKNELNATHVDTYYFWNRDQDSLVPGKQFKENSIVFSDENDKNELFKFLDILCLHSKILVKATYYGNHYVTDLRHCRLKFCTFEFFFLDNNQQQLPLAKFRAHFSDEDTDLWGRYYPQDKITKNYTYPTSYKEFLTKDFLDTLQFLSIHPENIVTAVTAMDDSLSNEQKNEKDLRMHQMIMKLTEDEIIQLISDATFDQYKDLFQFPAVRNYIVNTFQEQKPLHLLGKIMGTLINFQDYEKAQYLYEYCQTIFETQNNELQQNFISSLTLAGLRYIQENNPQLFGLMVQQQGPYINGCYPYHGPIIAPPANIQHRPYEGSINSMNDLSVAYQKRGVLGEGIAFLTQHPLEFEKAILKDDPKMLKLLYDHLINMDESGLRALRTPTLTEAMNTMISNRPNAEKKQMYEKYISDMSWSEICTDNQHDSVISFFNHLILDQSYDVIRRLFQKFPLELAFGPLANHILTRLIQKLPTKKDIDENRPINWDAVTQIKQLLSDISEDMFRLTQLPDFSKEVLKNLCNANEGSLIEYLILGLPSTYVISNELINRLQGEKRYFTAFDEREDISKLVTTLYSKARENPDIGQAGALDLAQKFVSLLSEEQQLQLASLLNTWRLSEKGGASSSSTITYGYKQPASASVPYVEPDIEPELPPPYNPGTAMQNQPQPQASLSNQRPDASQLVELAKLNIENRKLQKENDELERELERLLSDETLQTPEKVAEAINKAGVQNQILQRQTSDLHKKINTITPKK